MIRGDLRAHLLSKTAITDLLGQHIFLSKIPKSSTPFANYPALIYRRANGQHEEGLDGSEGHASPDFEFIATDRDPDVVESICEQLRLALQGFRGTMGTTQIDRLTLADEFDFTIDPQSGEDQLFYCTQLRYTIGYLEAVPTFS